MHVHTQAHTLNQYLYCGMQWRRNGGGAPAYSTYALIKCADTQ